MPCFMLKVSLRPKVLLHEYTPGQTDLLRDASIIYRMVLPVKRRCKMMQNHLYIDVHLFFFIMIDHGTIFDDDPVLAALQMDRHLFNGVHHDTYFDGMGSMQTVKTNL